MEDEILTIEKALAIAEREIAAAISASERLSKYEFGPVRYRRETDRYWVFSAGSKQLMAEGRVPGAVSACIDKVDGHVWDTEEQVRYAQSLSPLRPVAQPDSAAA